MQKLFRYQFARLFIDLLAFNCGLVWCSVAQQQSAPDEIETAYLSFKMAAKATCGQQEFYAAKKCRPAIE